MSRFVTRRSRVAVGATLVALCASMGVPFGAPAAGADDAPAPGTAPLEIRSIDATGDNTLVDVVYTGSGDASKAKVTIDGRDESVTSATSLKDAGVSSDAVLVFDNSVTAGNAATQIAKDKIGALQPENGPFSQLGVVMVGGSAAVIAKPKTNTAAVSDSIKDITATGGAALWDGVALAVQTFKGFPKNQHHLILVAASPDAGSASTLPDVAAALQELGVTVHIITLAGSSADVGSLAELADRQGGTLQSATPDTLDGAYGSVVSRVGHQLRLTVASKGTGEQRNALSMEIGDESAAASFRPGSATVGTQNLVPIVDPSGFLDGIFANAFVKYLIIILGMGAAGLAFYAVISLLFNRQSELADHLRHYDDTIVELDPDSDEIHQSLATSDILKRAVEMTGNLAQQRGFLDKVEKMLERADLPLRPAEAIFFYIAVVIASVLLSLVVVGNIFFAAAAIILAFILPGFAVDFMAKRRKKKFVRVLPDMLQLMSGTLRAGYSIGQAIEAVSQEVSEPMGKELRRVVTEARLGRHLEEALEAVGERMDSEDFAWAVMAIRIQREVGGNLAELLMTVADTMTQRERLRRDVSSLTAEGRISALVLGCLPPGLGAVMMAMNPDYIARLFEGEGLFLLGAGLVSMFIGFVWMKKCITIEI